MSAEPKYGPDELFASATSKANYDRAVRMLMRFAEFSGELNAKAVVSSICAYIMRDYVDRIEKSKEE